MVLKGKELMQYFMSGDENMEFEYLNTKPAVQNYLPTAGLDHIRLIRDKKNSKFILTSTVKDLK